MWQAVHVACLYFLFVNYAVSFGRRVFLLQLPAYVAPFTVLVLALAVRLAGGVVRRRNAVHAAAIAKLPSTLHTLEYRAQHTTERSAFWTKRNGRYEPTTYGVFAERVRSFALGLAANGVRKDDVLAILSANREEWVVANLAAMALGAASVGLYTSSSPEHIRFVLDHSRAKLLLVEDADRARDLAPLISELPSLEHVVAIDGGVAYAGTTYQQVLELGRKEDVQRYHDALAELTPEQLATIIYTSGTTGKPKGVMLSHQGILWAARELSAAMLPNGGERELLISYLPLSHIAEQISSVHAPLATGSRVYFAESLTKLPDNLREIRPTGFFSVPELWGRFQTALEVRFEGLPARRKGLLDWARRVTLERNLKTLAEQSVSLTLECRYQLAKFAVIRGIKRRLGLDRAWLATTSAAPIAREALDFFASLDIVLRELYGQSESTGPVTVNTPADTRFATLGRTIAGVSVRIADDGEVLVKSPGACLGYYRDPEASARLFDGEWMRTGDVGSMDSSGYLYLVGRKKELLKVSDGEFISAAPIEAALRRIAPIAHAVVVGDGRPYLAALVTLDPSRIERVAAGLGLPTTSAELATSNAFRNYLQQRIEVEVNPQFPEAQAIRSFRILPGEFTIATAELTPTLKVRRETVIQKYETAVAALYSSTPPPPMVERGELASAVSAAV
jgi:long-chain acyl-CoA synthetase